MKHLTEHPLRKTLSKQDWKRIQGAIDRLHEDATLEEILAAHDVFYDAVAAQTQTHLGSLRLQ